MGFSGVWILSAKALFISIGAASMAVFLNVSVPLVAEFVVSQLPLLWITVLSWLRPPYLYIVINAIIVSIAASSKLHRTGNHDTLSPLAAEENVSDGGLLVTRGAGESEEADLGNVPVRRSLDVDSTLILAIEGEEEKEEEEEFVISRSTWMPAKRPGSMVQEYLPQPSEKPLASSRFIHRKPAKSSPDGGKALKVIRPNRLETMENTWKVITEGRRAMPLTRHRRKSDVSENGICHQETRLQKIKKSETFRDRTNEKEESPVVRRPISPSRDELNRRVEAFIRKFNEEMRLQRQESLKNYKQMIRSSSDH